jgi:hypothetical protein
VKARRRSLALLLAAALALSGILATGCGGSDDGEQRTGGVTESFVDLVAELKAAALAGEKLGGVERAAELEPQEKKTLEAFCLTAWKLDVNDEIDRLPETAYVLGRIKRLAEFGFAHKDSPIVAAALARLRRDTELDSWDPAMDRRYKRACYD